MRNKCCCMAAGCIAVALFPALAPAQTTNFWTNTLSSSWSGAANWSNAVPAEGGLSNNLVCFWRAGTYTSTDDFTSFQLNQLSFSNATVTLAGNALSLVSNGASLPQVLQLGTTAVVISAPLVLSNQTTFAGAGTARITISGGISGPGGLTKANSYSLALTGTNSYTGPTLVGGSGLVISNNNALGNTSGLALTAAGSAATLDGGVTISGITLTNNSSSSGGFGAVNGTNMWAGPVILTGSGARFGAAAGSVLVLSGPISGSSGMAIRNTDSTIAGTVLISNPANSYTGGTTLYFGTLQLGTNNALPAATTLSLGNGSSALFSRLDLAGYNQQVGGFSYNLTGNSSNSTYFITNSVAATPSTFTVSNASATTCPVQIGGDLALVKQGAGLLTLGVYNPGLMPANNYSGGTTINGGALLFGHTNALPAGGLITINNGGALAVTNAAPAPNASINAWLSSGSIATNGANGVLALTYSPTETMDFSAVPAGYGNFGLGAVGTVTNGGTITPYNNTYRLGGGGGALVFTNALEGGAGFSLVAFGGGAAGVVRMFADNTYDGGTTLAGGTLNVTNDTALGAAGGGLAFTNGGALQTSGSFTLGDRAVEMQTGGGILNTDSGTTLVLSNNITGAGSLTKQGTGGALTLSGNNSFNGLTLTAGTLNINSASALGSGGVTINGGALDNTSGAPIVNSQNNPMNWNASFAFGGTTNLDLGGGAVTLLGATRTVTVSSNTLAVGGAIGDGGLNFGLTKAGAGTLVLGAAATYRGATTVSAGTLQLPGGTNPLSTNGAITAAGGVLDLGGGSQFTTNTVTFSGGTVQNGSLSNDAVAYAGQSGTVFARLSGAAGLNKTTAGTLVLAGPNTYTGLTVLNNSADNYLVASNTTGSGVALPGNIQLGTGNGANAYLRLGANEQIADTAVLTFSPGGTGFGRFTLVGFSETVGGLSTLDTSGHALVENNDNNAAFVNAGPSTLTLNVAAGTNYFYNGYLRSAFNGGSGQGPSNFLALVKTGPGTQTLLNAAINATGNGGPLSSVLVQNGALVLSNTTAFATPVTIGGGQLVLNTATTLNNQSVTNNAANPNGLAFLGITTATIGGLSGTGDIALTNETGAAVALTLGSGNVNGSYSGILGGSGSLLKLGTGTQTLAGASTYTGGTALNAGALLLTGGDNRLPTAGAITVTGSLLDLGGGSQYSAGAFTLNSGTVQNGSLSNDTAYAAAAGILSASLSGAAGLNKTGGGTLTLSGNNSFAGSVSVLAGALVLGNNNALGSTAGGTTVSNGAQLVLANGITIAGETVTIVGGSGDSFGALRAAVGASATWAGPVLLGDNTNIGRLGGFSNSVLTVSGPISDGAGSKLYISTENGTGRVVLSGTNNYSGFTYIVRGILQLGADETLPAGTTLDVHPLSLSTDRSTFDLNGHRQTVGQFLNTSQNSLSTVTNSSPSPATLIVNQSGDTTYGGTMGGNLSLVKGGVGTLTLSSVNPYTGSTAVSNGTLQIGPSGVISNTTLIHLVSTTSTVDVFTVTGGFHLRAGQQLQGVGTVRGGLIMDPGATLSPGNSPGTLWVTGDLTLGSGTTNYFDLVGPASGDLVEVGGALNLGGIQFSDFIFNPDGAVGPNQTYTLFHAPAVSGVLGTTTNGTVNAYPAYLNVGGASNNELQLTVIPEPATVSLLGLFAIALLLRRRAK